MKNKAILFGATALVLGGLVITPRLAEAYRGDPSVQGPEYSAERHEAMTQAFDSNDYQAWKEQMEGRGRVTEVITEENFARFIEAHRLALAGDIEGAAQIRAELGLGLRNGTGQGRGQGFKGQGQRLGNRQ